MLSELKVQNDISEKYGLYCYEWKDSRCNLCSCNMPRKLMPVNEEQSQKVWGTNWLINTLVRCRIHFWSSYSTTMFLNVVIKRMLPRYLILKFMVLWQLILKINCYVMNLTYIKQDFIQWTGNRFTVIIATVYIKMICITETLHYWRNLETRFV